MSTLDDWIADASTALGLPAESITLDLRDDLLDLTRDAAHGVARVAGPLTTYLVGLAVGNGMPPATAIGRLSELAAARATGGDEAAGGAAASGGSGDEAAGSGTAGGDEAAGGAAAGGGAAAAGGPPGAAGDRA